MMMMMMMMIMTTDDDDNNNNSYIALYTVKIYDPTALYIMKKQKEKLKQEKKKEKCLYLATLIHS